MFVVERAVSSLRLAWLRMEQRLERRLGKLRRSCKEDLGGASEDLSECIGRSVQQYLECRFTRWDAQKLGGAIGTSVPRNCLAGAVMKKERLSADRLMLPRLTN